MGLQETSETIKKLTVIMLETIEEAGKEGAPGGPLYLAMNSYGVDLSSFLIFMGSLVRLGYLVHRNDCYYITDKGRDYNRTHQDSLEMARRQKSATV